MSRQRIAPGTVGPVSTSWMGTDSTGREVAVPAPRTDGGEQLAYPKQWKIGGMAKVETPSGYAEFVLTRWRGLARVVDVDGSEYMIRRWRETKGAAEAATRQAGLDKLRELAEGREHAANVAALAAEGDLDTTVGTLLERALTSPSVQRLAPRTREAYAALITESESQPGKGNLIGRHDADLVAALPRNVDVAQVREFLGSFAEVHGSSSAARAKALLRRAFDLAVESRDLRVPFNPVLAARDAIPSSKVVDRGLDTKRVPTDTEVSEFLAALRSDPLALPLIGPRTKSRHGAAGTAPVNGQDLADLLAFSFMTGVRIGEATALRWSDLHLIEGEGTADVSGTVAWVKGQGTVRQERTKTRGSERVVPLSDELVTMLTERAELFEVDLQDADQLAMPVFGSPQRHDAWRQPGNLMKAVRAAFDRHGMEWASSHTGRRWRVTSLLDRGLPLGKVADVVGHSELRTTLRYVGRGRSTDADVRAAL